MGRFRGFFLFFLLSAGLSAGEATAGGFEEADRLVTAPLVEAIDAVGGERPEDFRAFAQIIATRLFETPFSLSARRFLDGTPLDRAERFDLYRLLGVYIQTKYRHELIALLGELVAIPTDKKDGLAQHANPNIRRFGEAIERIARDFGLGYRNHDERIFEVSLEGRRAESLGIYSHGDVVPADPKKWRLEDGTRLDPYRLTVIGERMYGRGSEDDKSAIASALLIMKVIREEGFALDRTIRLFIETTEETGGSATEYLMERYELPPYNLVLDGTYPVGVAEKGFGVVRAEFPRREAGGSGPRILEVEGGLAVNQIPSQAVAVIAAAEPIELKVRLDALAARYVPEQGGDFRIESAAASDRLVVTVYGVSAHSSAPESGVNPVSRLFDFLHRADREIGFQANHFTDAAAYAAENWGLDYLGAKLGIGYADDFMGPLTASVTYVKLDEDVLELLVNKRAPRGKEPEQLIAEIERGLEAWRARSGVEFSLEIEQERYMYRDPKGPWIATLLDIYQGVTGREPTPESSAGATTARQLPNGVQFGLGLPDERYTGHNANEFKKIENYLMDVQMITEMLLRLGNLERME